jgi:hypothetical protein
MVLPPSAVILCADVNSLYPSIPIDYGLAATQRVLADFDFDPALLPLVLDLLSWVLRNNFLHFDGQEYHQLSGTAMGTPVAVSYANLVLFYLESPILNVLQPLYYRRYIDDLFVICINTANAHACVSFFNAGCPTIKLGAVTIDIKGAFLDMAVQLTGTQDPPIVTSFQKDSNKYLYLPPTTSHGRHVLINIIKQERKRFRILNSRDANFFEIDRLYYQRLRARGYRAAFLTPLFDKRLDRDSLLASLRDSAIRNKLPKKSKGPVLTVTLPKLTRPLPLHRTVQLPPTIMSHPRYRQLYLNNVIIGRRYGKSIGRSLVYRKFSSRAHLQQSEDSAAEDGTRPTPNP